VVSCGLQGPWRGRSRRIRGKSNCIWNRGQAEGRNENSGGKKERRRGKYLKIKKKKKKPGRGRK
jgi:hypothetical protein